MFDLGFVGLLVGIVVGLVWVSVLVLLFLGVTWVGFFSCCLWFSDLDL